VIKVTPQTNRSTGQYVFHSFYLNKFGELLLKKYYTGDEAADEFGRYLSKIGEGWIRTCLNTLVSVNNLFIVETLSLGKLRNVICAKKLLPLKTARFVTTTIGRAYLGAAHNSSNLRRRKQNKVYIYVHDGMSYKFHF